MKHKNTDEKYRDLLAAVQGYLDQGPAVYGPLTPAVIQHLKTMANHAAAPTAIIGVSCAA